MIRPSSFLWAQGASDKGLAPSIAPAPKTGVPQTANSPATGLIDLTQVGTLIGDQAQRVTQAADAAAAADARKLIVTHNATVEQMGIANESLNSSAETRSKQLEILGGLDQLNEKAKLAISLSDSGNPLDRLKLWALQKTDPAYTRDGNLRRMEYYQAAAGAYGGAELLRQQGYDEQIKRSQNKMAMQLEPDNMMLQQLQISIDQGQRKIDALVNASTTRLDLMQKENAMQQAAITDLSADEVASARQIALSSPTQTANIKGVEVKLGTLEERSAALEDREYTRYARGIQRQVNEVSTIPQEEVDGLIAEAEAAPDRSVTRNGTKLSLAFLRERKAALSTQDFTMLQQQAQTAATADAMKTKSDSKILQTMNSTELGRIIENGGFDPEDPSYQYDMDSLVHYRDLAVTAEGQRIQQNATIASVGDPNQAIVDYKTYMDAVTRSAGDNSNIKQLMASQRDLFAYAANLMTSKDPNEVVAGAQMIQNLREQAETALTAEAKRLSVGDKNLELAYNAKLRGQPIPPETIATALHERVVKGKDVNQWLNPEQAVQYKNTFYAAQADIRKNNPMLGDSEVNDLAAERAMQALLPTLSVGVTEQLLSLQATMPTNPLYKQGWITGMTPTRILSMYHDADNIGIRIYQQQTGLNDEEMQKRVRGEINDPGLAAAQASAFLIELEKIRPGLAQQYVEWWGSDGRNQLVATYSEQVAANAAKGKFQDLSQMSLVLPTLNDQMSTYSTILNDGQRMMVGNELARQHQDYITFGGSASAKQAFLLEQDSNLSPSDKKAAMSLIFKPLIEAAQQQKLTAAQTNVMIEQQLMTMTPDDPATKQLLKKIRNGRDSALKIIDDFAKVRAPQPYTITGPLGVPYTTTLPNMKPGVENVSSGFEWYQAWQQEQQK